MSLQDDPKMVSKEEDTHQEMALSRYIAFKFLVGHSVPHSSTEAHRQRHIKFLGHEVVDIRALLKQEGQSATNVHYSF